MALIVNGIEIENVVAIKLSTGERIELEKLQDAYGTVLWEMSSGTDAEFEVLRMTTPVYDSGSSSTIDSSFVGVNVTAGEEEVTVTYGGLKKTVEPNTQANVHFGKYGAEEDDGTPVSGKMKISNAVAINPYSFSSAKTTTTLCQCITAINSFGSIQSVGENLCKGGIIETLKITENVRSIGAYAFSDCSNLREVIFTEGLIDIGDYVFQNSSLVTTRTLPSTLRTIGAAVFEGTAMSGDSGRIDLPNTIERIGHRAFPASIVSVNSAPANRTINLENMTKLAEYTFGFCAPNTILKVPKQITKFQTYADIHTSVNGSSGVMNLSDMTNLQNIDYAVVKNEGVTTVNRLLLPSNIENCEISVTAENIVSINSSVHGYCDLTQYTTYNTIKLRCGYTKVRFNSALKTIPNSICAHATKLVDIEIPATVSSIKPSAFIGCGAPTGSLATVVFKATSTWEVLSSGSSSWGRIHDYELQKTTWIDGVTTAPSLLCTSSMTVPLGKGASEWRNISV